MNVDPQVWTQDITHGYDAPLLTDTYELPDASALGVRMLGVSLEHGLLQGVDPESTEIMLAGLEHYLKDLIQQAFERVKRRGQGQDEVITAEDLSSILESSPNCFVEPNGPFYRLNDVMLRNDDDDLDFNPIVDENMPDYDHEDNDKQLNGLLNELLHETFV
jgi:transcriptional coactivator HFI1/ADA1